MRFFLVLSLFAFACATVTPTPDPNPPPPDAGSSCEAMCANLRTLGCPEGFGDGDAACEPVCRHVLDTHFTTLDTTCVAAAITPEGARACGMRCRR